MRLHDVAVHSLDPALSAHFSTDTQRAALEEALRSAQHCQMQLQSGPWWAVGHIDGIVVDLTEALEMLRLHES